MKESSFIISPIKFVCMNRKYELQFHYTRYMQIRGDSGTGKSLFVRDFATVKEELPQYKNSAIYDTRNYKDLKKLSKHCEYDYVIIDNADYILTEDVADIIYENLKNQNKTCWIIMGRGLYSCTVSLACIGRLDVKEEDGYYHFTVNYNAISSAI